MMYSTEVLREFIITSYLAAGDVPHAEAEIELRKALRSRQRVVDTVRETTIYAFGRWSLEQRVAIARALTSKQLPSFVDMMIFVDSGEQKLLRSKMIKDEAEYRIAKDLLDEPGLSTRQRLKLNSMVLDFERRGSTS